jgi:IclR family acetate operon transcriptional repressor
VSKLASAELPALSRDTGETATLSMMADHSMVYVEQSVPQRELIMSVAIGVPLPLHRGACSKAFLAFLPAAEIDSYFERAVDKITTFTVEDVRRIRGELEVIRERGWSETEPGRKADGASIAAPVLDGSRAPAAVISICGPADRLSDTHDAALDALLAATRRVSETLRTTIASNQ